MSTTVSTVARRVSAPLITVLVGALALMYAQTCFACSCIQASFAEWTEMADVIFVGTVSDADPSSGSGTETIQAGLTVTEVYRGEVGATAVVQTAGNSAACGVDFVPGATYLVMATQSGDTLEVSLCSGTAELSMVPPRDLATLGTSYAPEPGGVTSPEAAGADGAVSTNAGLRYGFGALGVFTLALGTAIWWPRRRIPRD